MAGGDPQGSQAAHIEGAQDRQRAVAERELGLPDGQEHVDHVGEAVMQRMGEAGDREGASGARPVRQVRHGSP